MISSTSTVWDKPSVSAVVPLCVDLDGTLVRSDLLMEGVLKFVKQTPWRLFMLVLWAMRGRAYLKDRLSSEVSLDVSVLPYAPSFLRYLRSQHDLGRRLILVTACPMAWARPVADYLRIFEDATALPWIAWKNRLSYGG